MPVLTTPGTPAAPGNGVEFEFMTETPSMGIGVQSAEVRRS